MDLLPYFLLLYLTEVTGFSLAIAWSAPPNIDDIGHHQLRELCVEFICM